MLAYVFWHWPKAGVQQPDYEAKGLAFHRALAQAGLDGFRGSMSFRIDGQAPWLGGSPAYADWYLVDDSATLDPLNEAAVSSARRGPHDVLAQAAEAGAGSLLRLHTGTPDVSMARWATFLAKPKGMPYEPFYQRLGPITARDGTSLWRRQMVLGPTPEFGILSREPIHLPQGFDSLSLRVEPLFG